MKLLIDKIIFKKHNYYLKDSISTGRRATLNLLAGQIWPVGLEFDTCAIVGEFLLNI